MTDRQALLDALLVERYGRNHWWATPTPGRRAEPTIPDHLEPDADITCARRRRELVDAWGPLDQEGTA